MDTSKHTERLPQAPDNLPGDIEAGNITLTPTQAAHKRALAEVRGNFADMRDSKFQPGRGHNK